MLHAPSRTAKDSHTKDSHASHEVPAKLSAGFSPTHGEPHGKPVSQE